MTGQDSHDTVEKGEEGLSVLPGRVLQEGSRRFPVIGIGTGNPPVEDVRGRTDDRPDFLTVQTDLSRISRVT
jgi:hypothetical protein